MIYSIIWKTILLKIKIYVKSMTGQIIIIQVVPDDTIQFIKDQMASIEDFSLNIKKLFYKGNKLENNMTLGYYKIQHDSTIP